MKDPNRIHIEFFEKQIPLSYVKKIADDYLSMFKNMKINNYLITLKEEEKTGDWIKLWVVESYAAFLIPSSELTLNKKDQIAIQFPGRITLSELKKYINFFSRLPSDAKVSAGLGGWFDGNYNIDKIREITVFPKYEVEKLGEENLLAYDKAYLVKKLSNGSVLVWLGCPYEENPFAGQDEDLTDFEDYLSELRKKKDIDKNES